MKITSVADLTAKQISYAPEIDKEVRPTPPQGETTPELLIPDIKQGRTTPAIMNPVIQQGETAPTTYNPQIEQGSVTPIISNPIINQGSTTPEILNNRIQQGSTDPIKTGIDVVQGSTSITPYDYTPIQSEYGIVEDGAPIESTAIQATVTNVPLDPITRQGSTSIVAPELLIRQGNTTPTVATADIQQGSTTPTIPDVNIEQGSTTPNINPVNIKQGETTPSIPDPIIEQGSTTPSIDAVRVEQGETTPIKTNPDIIQGSTTPVLPNPSIVQGSTDPVIPTVNIVQGSTTPTIPNPNIKQGSTDPVLNNPIIEQGETTPVVASPNIVQGNTTPLPSNPNIVQGETTPVIPNPNIQQGSTTPIPNNPNIEQGSTTPVLSNPNIVQGSSTPIPSNPNIEQGETTPIPSNPNIQQGSTTPIPSNPNIQQGSTTPIPSNPNIQQGSTTPTPSNPVINQGSTTPTPSNPTINQGSTTPTPSNPNIQQGSTTPTPSNPNINQGSTTPTPSNPNINQGSTTPTPSNPNIQQGSTTPTPINPNIIQGSTTPIPSNPNIQQGSTTPIPSNPNIQQGSTTPVSITPNINQGSTTPISITPNIQQGSTTPISITPNIQQGATLVNTQPGNWLDPNGGTTISERFAANQLISRLSDRSVSDSLRYAEGWKPTPFTTPIIGETINSLAGFNVPIVGGTSIGPAISGVLNSVGLGDAASIGLYLASLPLTLYTRADGLITIANIGATVAYNQWKTHQNKQFDTSPGGSINNTFDLISIGRSLLGLDNTVSTAEHFKTTPEDFIPYERPDAFLGGVGNNGGDPLVPDENNSLFGYPVLTYQQISERAQRGSQQRGMPLSDSFDSLVPNVPKAADSFDQKLVSSKYSWYTNINNKNLEDPITAFNPQIVDPMMKYESYLDNPSEVTDYVKLLFKDLRTKRTYQFRSYIQAITDNFNPTWQDVTYIGRPSPLKLFNNVTRDVSLEFIVPALDRGEMKMMYTKLAQLAKLTMPTGIGIMQAPIMEFTLGDWFVDEVAHINSLSFTIEDNYTWEVSLQNNFVELPHVIKVSMNIFIIGKTAMETNRYIVFSPKSVGLEVDRTNNADLTPPKPSTEIEIVTGTTAEPLQPVTGLNNAAGFSMYGSTPSFGN